MSDSGCDGSNYIPEEILVNILVRLPVLSLIRFMLVCKSWRNLIASSRFIDTHRHRNVKNHAHTFLIALHESKTEPKISHALFSNEDFELCSKIRHPLYAGSDIDIHGSSNGLVCLSNELADLNTPIYLCNLSIRKHVVLPSTRLRLPSTTSIYSTSVTFGFHSEFNDYKVVRMISSVEKVNCIEIEVYRLNTNSWKAIDAIPPMIKSKRWQSASAMFNGVSYWMMENRKKRTYCFVSFDTVSEVFEIFVLPDAVVKGINSMIDNVKELIVEYKGSVCLLQSNIDLEKEEDYIDMWVLQEKIFKKLMTVIVPGRSPYPLALRMNDRLLVGYCLKNGRSYMASYNLETKKVTKTGIRLAVNCYNDYSANTYVESLVLLRN